MELADGLHRIEMPLGERINAAYLFVGRDGMLVFDAGVDGDPSHHILPYLEALEIDPSAVRWIVISHCDIDHFGGLADAAQCFPQARTVAHRADAALIADWARFEAERVRWFRRFGLDESADGLEWVRSSGRAAPIDDALDDSSEIDLGDRTVQIRHLPGHSRGHLAVADPANGALAISDAILGSAVRLADRNPAFPPTYRYVDDYRATIDQVREQAPRLLLPAHIPPLSGSATTEFLDESDEFVTRLDAAIRAVFAERDGVVELDELCTLAAEHVGTWPSEATVPAMAFPVVGHVDRLVAEGVVREETVTAGHVGWAAVS